MTPSEAIESLESAGGAIRLDGDAVKVKLPTGGFEAEPLLAELRKHRERITELLRQRAGGLKDLPSESLAIEPQFGQQCPSLPRGVSLVRYEQKSPPVVIDVCSVVVDVGRFIQTELRELDARLHSPVQIRGGWGVFPILDRLRQAGLELEIATGNRKMEGGPE